MRYSEKFRNSVVARVLDKEITYSEAQQQYGVCASTVHYWVHKIIDKSAGLSGSNKGKNKPMSKLRLPRGVTCLKAYKRQ